MGLLGFYDLSLGTYKSGIAGIFTFGDFLAFNGCVLWTSALSFGLICRKGESG